MAGREKETVGGTITVPYRTRDSEHLATASAWATAWPRPYRQVFALIDGQRSIFLIPVAGTDVPALTPYPWAIFWLISRQRLPP